MFHPDFKFFRAVSMMIGALVGVGVFGIPAVFAKSGFAIGLIELLVIGALLIVLQFMYAELALQTDGNHRLAGYVKQYLGPTWHKLAIFGICASTWGALLAYMIVGGKFLFLLFGSPAVVSPEFFSYLLACVAAFFIYKGLKVASRMEAGIIALLLFLFLFIILFSLKNIHPAFVQTVDWSQAFLPYGVIIFALSSIGVVPEIKQVLGAHAHKQLAHAILIGMSVVIVLYALFAFAVVGVTGPSTTDVAFEGLIAIFGTPFRVMTSLLGSITVFSIFIMVGIQLVDILQVDVVRNKPLAWMSTMLVPIILFAIGFQSFVPLIGLIGGVFGGLIAILTVASYMKMKSLPFCRKKHCLDLPNVLSFLLIALFFGGMIYELIEFLV